MIILSPSLVAFSCIWILYGGFDAWPINTEIPGMTLLFIEHGISQSMAFRCKTLTSSYLKKFIFDTRLWVWGAESHPGTQVS
jgi:hypothetical protein